MSQVPFTEEQVKAFSGALGVSVPDGCIIVGNSAGAGACVNLSGDATLDNTGAIDIPAAGGLFNSGSADLETSSTNAGAISVSKMFTKITSAGAESRTLAAPAAVGQLKVIYFLTDGGDVTIAGTNVWTKESLTLTLNDAGDFVVLMGMPGSKWGVICVSGCAFA